MEGIRQAGRLGTLLAVALLAAACSSGSSGPGVADAANSTGASASSSASSGQSGSSSQSAAMARGIAYAKCMRSHGEPQYPDPSPGPNGQGAGWQLGPNIDPSSAQYQAATKACGQPPNLGGTPPQPLTAAQQKQYLQWAACIRAHGVPSFKDPTFSNGYPQFTSTGHGAQMQAAQQACKQYLQGIPGGGGGTFTG